MGEPLHTLSAVRVNDAQLEAAGHLARLVAKELSVPLEPPEHTIAIGVSAVRE